MPTAGGLSLEEERDNSRRPLPVFLIAVWTFVWKRHYVRAPVLFSPFFQAVCLSTAGSSYSWVVDDLKGMIF